MDGFLYGCLRENGNIITGEDVKKSAQISPGNYAVSWSLKTEVTPLFITNMRTRLLELSHNCKALLLSSEGWTFKADKFKTFQKVFEGFDVEVILVVRPPVQWMNSAWWQWQQWSNIKIDSWANGANVAGRWVDSYESFNQLDFIKKVNVLSLNKDILIALGKILAIDISVNDRKHNSASSSELLSFLRMKRSLRPGAHDAQNEFILNKYLRKRSSSDWVLSEKNISNILKNSNISCTRLAELITNEDIKQNDLWWKSEAYDKNVSVLKRNRNLGRQVLSSMLEEAYQIIIKLDHSMRHQNSAQDSIGEIINIAKNIEKDNLQEAYRLMKVARGLRPNGAIVNRKIAEYEKRISRQLR
jgi:hypothetical protein